MLKKMSYFANFGDCSSEGPCLLNPPKSHFPLEKNDFDGSSSTWKEHLNYLYLGKMK